MCDNISIIYQFNKINSISQNKEQVVLHIKLATSLPYQSTEIFI